MTKPLHFLVLAAMIRLGRKYEILSLRDEALTPLRREFPVALDEHEKLPVRRHPDLPWTHFTFPSDQKHQHNYQKMHAIIQLAHECSIQSILPALYLSYAAREMVSRSLPEFVTFPNRFDLENSAK